jgi:tocopherol O-methyltransferase
MFMATAAAVRAHYDSLALIYRTYWGDHIHHGLFVRGDESAAEAQQNMIDYCNQAVGVRRGCDVLDMGCGHGGTAVYLASRFSCRVQGVTLSEKQARMARENAARSGVQSQVEFVVGDADSYALPTHSYDLVWTMESSEHFRDKAGYFRRVAAALRKNGSLLLAAWTGEMSSERVRAVADAFLCPELQSAQQYASQIEAAGLRVRSSADLTAQVVRTWEICREHARRARAIVALLPQSARHFVEGFDTILDAYRGGELTYTVLVADA